MFKGSRFLIMAGYILLSYPLFYFSYKFCLPDFGGEDFYAYYPLYKSWDFSTVDCPFNMRLISCFAVFLMNKAGFNYDTEIIFTTIHPEYDQQVFFNAVLLNYLFVIATCLIIYKTVKLISNNQLYAFLSGCIYLLGFGTLFFALKPISESCGIFLLGWAFYYYIQKKPGIYLVFLICLFQREYIFIVFGIMAVLGYIFERNKYFIWVLISCLLLFSAYIILRKTVFYTPRWDYQTSIPILINSLFHSGIEFVPFIKQSLFISNIFWIYVFVIIWKKSHALPIDNRFLITILVLLAQILVMSVMARFGNNAGRYFYYLSPILICHLFVELKPLISPYLNQKENV